MDIKTQASTMSLKSLGGVFEQQKMNHRRDFLRENKLSLRDLQKTTNQKLTQQKQEYENRQYKHIQKFHKTQEQSMARRSASKSRNFEQNCKRQSRINAADGLVDTGVSAGTEMKGQANYLSCRRTYSQQRHKVENLQPVCTCCCNQQKETPKNSDVQYHECMPRSATSVSVLSKAVSCDKEIQTEDIHDENFLYEALKKCSSSEVHQLQKQKSMDQLIPRDNCFQNANSNHNSQKYQPESNSKETRDQAPYVHQDHYEENKFHHDQMLQHTPRFQNPHMFNGHNYTHEDEMSNGLNQDLDQHFCNLKIANDMRRDPESQLSARSRQTLCSTSTKRSSHKLGSREDVRLPRYLEKEKREKEEERERELNRDLNCPIDHFALSEEERLKALNKSQQKMASLINELNHMPMTMETLRIRKRKNEIEKELTQLELGIRLYSKPKVYIPITTTQY